MVRGVLRALAAGAAALATRGEVVLAVAGAAPGVVTAAGEDLEAEIRRRRAAGASVRDVAASLARERGLARRELYQLVLALER
jgi:16S rRNA (cytidine1402-2'-O)-methyltransferase